MVILNPRQIESCEALDSGERKPRTSLQKRFVRVCRGEVAAVTSFEKAYLKLRYAKEAERKRKQEIRKIAKQAEDRLSFDLARQKEKYRKPTRRIAEWGTREDSKRDRGSWRR